MLGVFSLYITPRDFLHHFAGHEDTFDEAPAARDGKLSVSEKHRHCEWLQWEVDTYLPPHEVFLECIPVQFRVVTASLPVTTISVTPYFFSLRAPPSTTNLM